MHQQNVIYHCYLIRVLLMPQPHTLGRNSGAVRCAHSRSQVASCNIICESSLCHVVVAGRGAGRGAGSSAEAVFMHLFIYFF